MSNRPTHIIKLTPKNEQYGREIGVAWTLKGGGLGIRLHPGIVLSHRDCQDHYISAWPVKPREIRNDLLPIADGPQDDGYEVEMLF